MATIEQRKSHAYPKEEARKKAENLAEELKAKLKLEWVWRGDTIDFEAKSGTAKGVKGTVDVSDKEIVVKIDLPFMLRPLKGMVESRVKDKLDKL